MSFDELRVELDRHEREIERISNELARVAAPHDDAGRPAAKAEVLYLQAQVIRHRISLALLDAQAQPMRRDAA